MENIFIIFWITKYKKKKLFQFTFSWKFICHLCNYPNLIIWYYLVNIATSWYKILSRCSFLRMPLCQQWGSSWMSGIIDPGKFRNDHPFTDEQENQELLTTHHLLRLVEVGFPSFYCASRLVWTGRLRLHVHYTTCVELMCVGGVMPQIFRLSLLSPSIRRIFNPNSLSSALPRYTPTPSFSI